MIASQQHKFLLIILLSVFRPVISDWIDPAEVDKSDIKKSYTGRSDIDVMPVFCILAFAAEHWPPSLVKFSSIILLI